MWEKDIQLEELNTENSASYEEICERYVLSHVPKKDQEGLLGKMDYEKVAEILSYKLLLLGGDQAFMNSLAKAVAVAEQSYAAAENANNCRGAS